MEEVTLHELFCLPSALIDDVCFGTAAMEALFEKHGYTPSSAAVFAADDRFRRLVNARAVELEKEGITDKMRDGALANAARDSLFHVVLDPNTSVTNRLEIYKHASKLAGREPKGPDLQSQTVPFSVNIIIPDMSKHAKNEPKTVESEAILVEKRSQNLLNSAEFEVI